MSSASLNTSFSSAEVVVETLAGAFADEGEQFCDEGGNGVFCVASVSATLLLGNAVLVACSSIKNDVKDDAVGL